MSQVGDDQAYPIGEYGGGVAQTGAASRLILGGVEVGLPQHHVGTGPVGGGDGVINQHAMVQRVGHEQLLAIQEHAVRRPHAGRVRTGGRALEIALAEDHIGRGPVGRGDLVVDQHTAVAPVSHGQALPVAADAHWPVERSLGKPRVRLAEVRLPDDHAGRRAHGQLGKVVEDQDAVVSGRGKGQAAIAHNQTVTGDCQARDRAHPIGCNARSAQTESLLADDGDGSLAGNVADAVRGLLRQQGRRRKS